MGDTIIFAGTVPNDNSPPQFCPAVIASQDNGQTFGEWQCLDSSIYSYPVCHLFGGSGKAFALVQMWLDRSMNAGLTWLINRQPQANWVIYWGVMTGDNVITIEGRASPLLYRMVISADGGAQWNPGVSLDMLPDVEFFDVAATQSHLLLLASLDTISTLGVARGSLDGESWSPFVSLPNSSPGGYGVSFIIGDTTSEIVMVRERIYTQGWDNGEFYVFRSTDGGQSWEDRRHLSDAHPISLFYCVPELFYHTKLWGVVWEDFYNPDTTRWGVYCRLSANHGKDWYPAQSLGLDVPGMNYSGGQFVGDEMRVYWNDGGDYGTATGILTPDTSAPAITLELIAPDTVHANDTLTFQATVDENDTLSEVRVALADSNGALPAVVLVRAEQFIYEGSFVVPHAGVFSYRGEAEDFWENIGADPDSGWRVFATEGFSEAHDAIIVSPSSFSLSLYPNPSNGWPMLTLAPEWIRHGPATIAVYNVVGQKFSEVNVSKEIVRLGGGCEAGTGIYFARVTNGQRTAVVKFLIVK
jgi:hypothetical protein